jgi:hypothetical protein
MAAAHKGAAAKDIPCVRTRRSAAGAAGPVWFTNVLVFALAFWELDRGGPVTRIRVARAATGGRLPVRASPPRQGSRLPSGPRPASPR